MPRDNLPLQDAFTNPLVLCEGNMTGEQVIETFRIDRAVSRFEESKNPVVMIEAFLLAKRAGVFPPNEAMDWLAGCFEAFHDGQGKVPMDTCMGLKKRGATPPVKALLIEERNEMIFTDMSALMHLGATREEAAQIVAITLDVLDWNKTVYDISDPSCETLIDLHARWPDHRTTVSWASEHLDKPGSAANFLQKFDRQHLPEKLLRLL
jgi:hypothetical protein